MTRFMLEMEFEEEADARMFFEQLTKTAPPDVKKSLLKNGD